MDFIIKNNSTEKDREKIYQLFYQFYEKLYGKEILHKFRIKNMISSEKAINMLNDNESMKLLKVVDEDELLAISRFRINDNYDELIVSEIIVDKKAGRETSDQIYKSALKFYEEYAMYSNLPMIYLEMPWFDRSYQYWASQFDYQFPTEAELYDKNNTTYLVRRNTHRFGVVNNDKKIEWSRSRKQTRK